MKRIMIAMIAWVGVLPVAARAEPVQALSNMIEQQLNSMQQAMAAPSSDPRVGQTVIERGAGETSGEVWYFKNFLLRARCEAGFSVPGFASLVVVPEAEFTFQHDIPDGMTPYTPQPI